MRIAALIVAALAAAAAAPALAQTYDPAYPVCMHVFGRIAYYDCRFSSIPQCRVSASGRGAQCEVNPYFAGRPPARRQRHVHYR